MPSPTVSWSSAATAKAYSYRERAGSLGLPGLLFRAGEKTQATFVVDALRADTPFIAGTVTGQYASDSSIPRMLASSFVGIPLERSVPNIVLLGSGLGMLKLAGIGLGGRQKLSLEGDFDRSFTLYCPEGYERDALEIFTPNLMQRLVDTTGGCDVELVDDWMFVYSRPGRYRDGQALEAIESATALVQSTIHRQTARYADGRVTPLRSATVSPEEHAARAGGVATEGRRVKTSSTRLQKVVLALSWAVFLVAAGYVTLTWLLPRL